MARGRRGRHGPHRAADIAQQAGVSAATVDRVLHGRAGVSARAVSQVEQALLELDRQQTQLRLAGRTLLLDLVMLAPSRFSAAVRKALEQELPGLRPATVRARFHLRERGAAADLVDILDRLSTRGPDCQGLLLKAPDDPGVVEADNYGPITQHAVAGFNAKHHLNDTGKSYDPAIGPRGWALLMHLAYGS